MHGALFRASVSDGFGYGQEAKTRIVSGTGERPAA
jgi:hypothetical protein